ncbi:MAG: hypothetical protein DRP01_03905 [Archaeoglobales archaeon]|nr:MAG: hypothetical protein DRP01_03905 [Archaeoglobales archaeon]
MFRRVLFATDLSERSLNVLKSIKNFRCLGIEEILLVRVVNISRFLGARGIDINSYVKEIESESVPKLENVAREMEDLGFKAKLIMPLPVGDPVGEIVKIAEDEAVDLIIMGSRGRSTIKAILLGSTAEGVINKTEIPVIVFKDHQGDVFNRILYAHDLSKKAENLGVYVRFVAKHCNSDVVVVHILERGEILEENWIGRVVSGLREDGINVKIVIGDGNPPKEIVKIAEIEGASCIFVGRSGIGSRILGSTADFIVRYSKVPVFVA